MDSKHRHESQEGPKFERVLIDIKHLDISRVIQEQNGCQRIVAVSKHLCGEATDLTLRCLSRLLNKDSDCSATVSAPLSQGVLIALCCHQRCAWGSFFGHEVVSSLGFTPVDFHLITHMTSWGVCGVRSAQLEGKSDHETVMDHKPVQNPNGKPLTDETIQRSMSPPSKCPPHHDPTGYHDNGYRPHPKEAIGLKCKRLLDFCRVKQLRQSGYQVQLVYYTRKDVSLENVLLLATTK